MIRMILAVDSGNAIGWQNGDLPWKIPADMKRFKELTTGGTVVMGFNTFKSLGRIDGLPNRENFVLTRRPCNEARGQLGDKVSVISNLDYVRDMLRTRQARDIWIIGGASVYAEAIDKQIVDEIYLTLVDANSGADVTLKHDFSAWKLFILQQQKLGVYWELEDIQTPVSDPAITFIKLAKLK